MSDYNQVPIKIEGGENEQYVDQLDHHHQHHQQHDDYGDDEMLSPNDGGDFADYPDYADDGIGGAGGKLRLKRRRKCGQCGPCQVKENCDKCHYCMRRDVLKQSCIYRKCLYLRKKQSRMRSESFEAIDRSPHHLVQSMLPASPPPVMCMSPDRGSVRSPPEANSFCLPQPNSVYTSPVSATSPEGPSPMAQSPMAQSPMAQSPMAQSPMAQSPTAASPQLQSVDPLRGFHQSPDGSRPFSHDSLRSQSAERPKSHQGDVRSTSSDGFRSPPMGIGPLGMSAAQAEFLRSTDPYHAHMQHLHHLQSNPLSKDQIGSRGFDQLRHLSPEQCMPYGSSRHIIPPPGVPSPFSFNPSNISPSSASPLGLPAACRYSIPPQASFHPHLAYNASLRPPFGATPASSSIIAPPFYPPPAPTSLASLPLGQYPPGHARSYPPGGFPSPHPALYPGGIYPPFRPPSEPFIYHAHFPHPSSVFSEHAGHMARFRDHYLRKADEEEDCKKFDVFRLTKKTDTELMREKYMTDNGRASADSPTSETAQLTSRIPMSKPLLDNDLLEQMNNIARVDPCNVTISIDDLKMQAFIRSDGANNLEIEIESPTSSSASTLSPNASSNKYPSKEPASSDGPSYVCRPLMKCCGGVADRPSDFFEKRMPCLTQMLRSKRTVSGTVCLKQDLGDEGIIQLELPGHKVQLEDTLLDERLVKQSDNPSELIKFISDPLSSHFPETIIIH